MKDGGVLYSRWDGWLVGGLMDCLVSRYVGGACYSYSWPVC